MTPGKIHTDSVKGKMFVADGGKSVEGLLEPTGEPFRPEMQAYADAKELGVHDMWKLQAERSHLQQQYLEQWMSHDGLDAILGECRP
jgi:amidase